MGERKDPALDELAIREFLQTHGRRIVAGLSILAGSQAVAEEAVQEALARAWERSERGERIESLAGWVATVATNILRSARRRRAVERRARARLGGTLRDIGAFAEGVAEDRIDVGRAIRSLPERQRAVVILHYYADMDLARIADALSTSEGAVKQVLHRARRSLAKGLLSQREMEGEDSVRDR